ncbi:hypothetical protein AJ78_09044 [Emergomyces pasteurianus Ep9510]|uniref:Uncharacterized protein n=1 Tax=Emergomyces pasteurianus Ep9510 TaxID=1447872 RepID=A0A1J9NZW1_9EURO|nr:hypothetical protein AJ78_09044 [Emergomyces pasteurianus Ep9510]
MPQIYTDLGYDVNLITNIHDTFISRLNTDRESHLTKNDPSNVENEIEYTNSISSALPSGQTIFNARTSSYQHMPDTDVAFQNDNELSSFIDLSDMNRALQNDSLFLD